MKLIENIKSKKTSIAIIGMGYVGIQLAYEFSKHTNVIGFDIDNQKIELLRNNNDPTHEIGHEKLMGCTIDFTSNESKLDKASLFIISVPTPVDNDNIPDLSPLISSTKMVSLHLKKGDMVSYESTVFPGMTEDICIPLLEGGSNLKCGRDFKVCYSPERINPGDKVHTLTNIQKVISAIDAESLDEISKIYKLIIDAGVYKVSSIKVAEAVKVIDYVVRNNMTENYPSFSISQGDNWFIAEIYKPQKPCAPIFQFSDFFKQCQEDFISFSSRKKNITFNNLNFVCDTFFIIDEKFYFMLCSNNDNIKNVTCIVKDEFNRVLDSFNVILESITVINCSKYDYLPNDYFQVLNLEFIYECEKTHNYFVKSILKKKVSFWFEEMVKISNQECWHSRLDVQFFLQQYNGKKIFDDDVGVFWDVHRLYDIFFDTYHSAQREMREKNNKGCIDVLYYRSSLDEGLERIMFHLPYKYNKSERLPLIINLSMGRYSWNSYSIDNINFSEKFIFADVSLRGSTLGSYIGEANFLESFNLIKKQYLIDETRVYLIGASNGAYGVWNLIEKFPHFFAAAIPLSGNTNEEFIYNASNIPILDLRSDSDGGFFKDYDEMCKKLGGVNPNYRRINCTGLLHTNIISFLINKKTIEWCLKFKRNLYPNNIYLTTVKDRNNRAYWIKINGIISQEKKASLSAKIIGQNIIINVKGVTGLQIEIPPLLRRKQGIISINGQNFEYDCNNLIHNYAFRGDTCLENIFIKKNMMQIKGSGILFVYYQSMEIYVPQADHDQINKIAYKLAHPKTYSQKGVVSVNYPIYNRTPKNCKKSFIYFELIKGQNKCMDFDLRQFIQCDYRGFKYKGERFDGEYVVMQIVCDFKSNNSNLLILSNSESSLREHFFLRNFIIPGDVYGIHPYLNNCALIYFEKTYKRIYEWGMNIENIEKRD